MKGGDDRCKGLQYYTQEVSITQVVDKSSRFYLGKYSLESNQLIYRYL